MATKKYCVLRTDKVSGEVQLADMVSFRFYDGDGDNAKPAEVENGVIVELKGLEDAQHEIYKAVAATSASKLNDCVIAAGVELMYDERKHFLDEYINEAGKPTRGYIPRSRNVYSWTKEGFVGGTVPKVGDEVGIGADGKLDASGSGLGKCIDIDIAGRYTYYAIQLAVTENA